MGSGSYGGGGGGGGGGSGAGGGSSGSGGGGSSSGAGGRNGNRAIVKMRGYSFRSGRPTSAEVSAAKARDAVRSAFAKLSRDARKYVLAQFCSPMVRRVFEQVFLLAAPVFQDRRWDLVADHFNVGRGRGCLREWVEHVIGEAAAEEPSLKVRETIRMCLEDFLVTALGNDIDTYLSGDGNAVVQRLDKKVFDSASGYFLGALIWRVLEREIERLPETSEAQLRNASQRLADQIVGEFEHKFKSGQVTHRQIFRVLQDNQEWLVEELRK
jgi:hypothetical protein